MLNETEARILMRWWQSLMLPESELQKNDGGRYAAPSGQKAGLRRADSVDAAMMQDAFRALWLALPEQGALDACDMERWAVIAASLMHVTPGHQDTLATAAGKKIDASGKPAVSEMRFAQLQAAGTPDELLRTLRRLLQLTKGKTGPLALAHDIDQWFDEYLRRSPLPTKHRISVKWAMDYYRAAK